MLNYFENMSPKPANPPGSTDPIITDEVLATRAGCLRFPNEAAAFIAELDVSSSS